MNLDIGLSILLIFCAACYVLMGIRLITARREVGSVPIGVLFVIISFWIMGGAVELMSDSFLVFSIGRTGHFVGTTLLPLAAFVCFREYTGTATSSRTIVLLLILPVVSVTLAATNQYHEFMWHLPAVNEAGDFLTRPEKWGPWFLFVHAPYSYALIGAAMFTLVVHSSAVAPAHRRGLFLLVAACIGPLIATLAYDFGIGSNVISFVPFVFAAMLPIYIWLIVGEGIVEFAPLAYETVFQNMQDPVIVIDEQQRIIGLNHRAEAMLCVSEQEALRTPLEEIFADGSTVVFEALETQKPQKMMTSTGRFLHVQASPINSDRASIRGGRVLMFRDVSDVEKAQSEVRKSEKLLRTLIDHSVNGVIRFRWVQDEDLGGKDLRCIFANAAAGRFLNSEPDDLVDLRASEITRRAMTGMDAHTQCSVLEKLRESCESGESMEVELLQTNAGGARFLRLICQPVGDDIAATFIDVTDSKAKEKQMESIAWSDPLTGVLNRRGFERDAAQRLTDSADDATGALLFIDLNDFKEINDRYGHVVGDQLLTIAAQRLRKALRSQDIIGRPGGDEFVALVPDVSDEIADKLAQRLAKALEAPYNIGSETMDCAASIGLALYPANASTLTGLLREADQAMYRAKARTRGASELSHDDLLEKAI
jgi:diguanylate cyclase (GGDEF)-like protein/PAS domain S-box-containing protein